MSHLKPRDYRRLGLAILQVGVAVGLLTWVFSDRSLRADIGTALKQGHLWALGLGVLAAGIGIAANVWRWSVFLRIQGIRVRPLRLTVIFLIGMAFNLIGLGSLGGDAARAVLVMRDHPGNKRAIIVSIFADHFSAIIALAFSAGAFALTRYAWFRESAIGTAALSFTLIFFAISLLVLVLSVLAAVDHNRRLLPRFLPARDRFIAVADRFKPFAEHWRSTLLACAISFLVLYAHFFSFYCGALAFDAGVGVGDIFAIMPVVEAVTTLPISFSGLGVREGLFIELLGAMAGTPAAIAVLISLTGFACTLFWSLVGGILIPFHNRHPLFRADPEDGDR